MDRYNYHLKLRKAESSIAVQFRGGKNEFNHFLHKVRVPGVLSTRCSCGWRKQDAKHILLHCPELSDSRREPIKEVETHDIRIMLA